MHPMLNIAIQAVRKAGNFTVQQYELFDQKNKQLDYINNFINHVKKESNRIISEIIKKFYPLHIIVTQYNCVHINLNNAIYYNHIYWIIKCIDSDTNFIKKFPFFALSIAVQRKGKIEVGVIYDPIHNELFSACSGKGAQLNGYRIRINTTKNLYQSVIAVSFSEKKKYIATDLLNKICNQYLHIDFRRTGATTLDLAYVASGRVDGCFAIFCKKNHTLLLASGSLIIREAGGLIINWPKTDNHLSSGSIIAGNPKIIQSILSAIQ